MRAFLSATFSAFTADMLSEDVLEVRARFAMSLTTASIRYGRENESVRAHGDLVPLFVLKGMLNDVVRGDQARRSAPHRAQHRWSCDRDCPLGPRSWLATGLLAVADVQVFGRK